ncbi:MAG: hypothetical protein WCJ70_03525 [bacterium]
MSPERKTHTLNAETEAVAHIESVRDEMKRKAGATQSIGIGPDGKLKSIDGGDLIYDLHILEDAAKNPELFGSLVAKERYRMLLNFLNEKKVQNVLQGTSNKETIAIDLKGYAVALRQIMNMLADAEIKKRMIDIDKKDHLPAEEQIADKHPTALDFLVRIGKKKPTLFALAKIAPLAVKIVSSPGYFQLKQPELLKNIKITETKGLSSKLEVVNGMPITSPHVGSGVSINLLPGSLEYDLVMMKVNEEDELFDMVWECYAGCVNGASEKEQKEIVSLSKDLLKLKNDISTAADKIKAYKAGTKPADVLADVVRGSSKKLTADEQAELKRLSKQEANHIPLSPDEKIKLKDLRDRVKVNQEEAIYNVEMEIKELEDKLKNHPTEFTDFNRNELTRLKKALEDMNSKNPEKKSADIAAQLQKVQLRLQELAAKEPKTTEILSEIASLSIEQQRLNQESLIDASYKQQFFDNSEREHRLLSESLAKQMKDSIKFSPDAIERKRVERAESFIKECHSIDSYIKNFYQPLFHEIREEVKLSSPTLHGHELEERVADRVDGEIQSIISYVVTFIISPALESGGEPVGSVREALAKTRSVGLDNSQKLSLIQRALTRLKMNGAKLHDLPGGTDEHLLFADTYRETQDVWDPVNRRTTRERYGRVKKECHHSGEAFWKHARNMEEFFEVMQDEMFGNFDIRASIHEGGGEFYKEIGGEGGHHGKLQHYAMAKQFDMVHDSEIGPEVAAAFPLAKTLMMRYFSEKGWVVDDEIEKEAFEPKGYLHLMVNQFMAKNYPDYSETKRNMITYIAVKQAYLHSVYQLMLSNSKPLAGFTGMKHKFGNFYFNERAIAHKFPASLSHVAWEEFLSHRAFDKGSVFLPASLGGFDAIKDIDPTVISNYTDMGYGAVMYELSGKYGYFLRHFNPHFEKHLPDIMAHQNRFNVGSDDHLRGWRQQKKSKDNVSQKLFGYADRKDWCTIGTYAGADHLTLLWKSVENLGTNYLRAWTDDVVLSASYETSQAKYKHLTSYLYQRYFDGCKLGVDFGRKVLESIDGGVYAGVKNEADFFQKIDAKIRSLAKANKDKKKSDSEKIDSEKVEVYKNIFYAVHTILMAERTPTVFMDATTPWGEQTGVTLIAQLKTQIMQDSSDPMGLKKSVHGETKFDNDLWKQTTDDLVFVQKEARGGSSRAILDKRAEWENKSEKDGLNSNTFGDFSSTRSSFRLEGSDEDGYVITDAYLTSVLTKKYSARPEYSTNGSLNEKGTAHIKRVLELRRRILAEMLKAPELPKYEDVVADMLGTKDAKGYLPRAVKSPDDRENKRFIRMITEKIGTKEQYEARYRQKLRSRNEFFMDKWKKEELTFQPEADAAENFMHYENADADHMGRMARDIQDTAVHVKDDLNPDKETSVNEMIKNFAKDPFAAIDKMAEYLNPYRKKIEDAKGAEASQHYVGWYVNRVLQANLKEERFRNGFTGMFEDVRALLFGQNKTSMAGDKNQPYTSKSLSAYQTNRVIRYLIQKKLIGGNQGDEYMKRYRGTWMDVLKEMAPRIGTIALIAGGIHLIKSSTDGDSDLK